MVYQENRLISLIKWDFHTWDDKYYIMGDQAELSESSIIVAFGQSMLPTTKIFPNPP